MENEENNINERGTSSSPLLDAAIAMHEMYITFIEAGFSPVEALTIVIQSVKPSPPQ